MTGQQLELASREHPVDVVEVLDGIAVVGEGATEIPAAATTDESALAQRNLFGEAEWIAARAASAGTRRQYAAIYRAFGQWLLKKLGRPPIVGDLDADVTARLRLAGDLCPDRGQFLDHRPSASNSAMRSTMARRWRSCCSAWLRAASICSVSLASSRVHWGAVILWAM